MYDVITLGSATIDAFVDTGSRLFEDTKKKGLYHIPFGGKILISDVKFKSGGGATNTAVAFSRMGLKTAVIAKIGLGTNGERVFNELVAEGIDTSLIVRKGERTGYSVILDAKGHDRTILAYKGGNDKLAYSEIKKNKCKAKWLYCSSMVGKSFETLQKMVDFCSKKGVKVMFNPSSYLVKRKRAAIKKILKKVEVLIFNKEEAGLLVHGDSRKGKIEQLVKDCWKYGPKIVIVTDGKNQVYAYDGEKVLIAKPHGAKPVETTGAGDSFASGFLSGYIRTGSVEKALGYGVVNSESVIVRQGAKNKLLTWAEANKILRKKPVKVRIV